MPKGSNRPPASCHPERLHYAHGLCHACYAKEKYVNDPVFREKTKESGKVYRQSNKDMAREASRKYYRLNRSARIAKAREYVRENPERARLQRRKYYVENRERLLHKQRLERVGLTESDYDHMIVDQKGVCAICKQTNRGRQLIPDHCHQTMIVRGLLCHNCNVGIGLLKDSAEILESALLYLQQKQSTQEKVIYL